MPSCTICHFSSGDRSTRGFLPMLPPVFGGPDSTQMRCPVLEGSNTKDMYTEYSELPAHEQIERRAYQMYLEHGFHPGNDLADWLAAEKELTDRLDSEDSNSPPEVLRKYARA